MAYYEVRHVNARLHDAFEMIGLSRYPVTCGNVQD
jgi:hypothetical protein